MMSHSQHTSLISLKDYRTKKKKKATGLVKWIAVVTKEKKLIFGVEVKSFLQDACNCEPDVMRKGRQKILDKKIISVWDFFCDL